MTTATTADAPIGIFDSGVGGLTVARAVLDQLPTESIRDVVRPYGQQGLVRIADDVDGFVAACAEAMAEPAPPRITQADAFLRQTSWDGTWRRIQLMMDAVLHQGDIGRDTGHVAV